MHHGRDWAHHDPNMKDARPAERVIEDIAERLAKYPPLGSIDESSGGFWMKCAPCPEQGCKMALARISKTLFFCVKKILR